MAIEIGGMVRKIEQKDIHYQAGDPPAPAVMYVREVTFEQVGLPIGVVPPQFVVPVTDATKWNEIKVGDTYTVSISGGSIP